MVFRAPYSETLMIWWSWERRGQTNALNLLNWVSTPFGDVFLPEVRYKKNLRFGCELVCLKWCYLQIGNQNLILCTFFAAWSNIWHDKLHGVGPSTNLMTRNQKKHEKLMRSGCYDLIEWSGKLFASITRSHISYDLWETFQKHVFV